jgi:acetate kinase
LSFLGVDFDEEANLLGRGIEKRITKQGSRVEVLVIPTNEEWVIAQDTYVLVQSLPL